MIQPGKDSTRTPSYSRLLSKLWIKESKKKNPENKLWKKNQKKKYILRFLSKVLWSKAKKTPHAPLHTFVFYQNSELKNPRKNIKKNPRKKMKKTNSLRLLSKVLWSKAKKTPHAHLHTFVFYQNYHHAHPGYHFCQDHCDNKSSNGPREKDPTHLFIFSRNIWWDLNGEV